MMKSIFALFFLIALSAVSTLSANAKPNILFVIIDDLRPLLKCYGDPTAVTPNIDKLASDGIVFERAYVQYPICGPSRASFMSGMRPDTTGFMTNSKDFTKEFAGTPTINRYFKSQGYSVFGAGKIYHSTAGPKKDWSKPYFKTQWLDYVLPENRALAKVFFSKNSKGLPPSVEAADVDDDQYCDGKAAAKSEKWIAEAAKSGKPFLMMTGFRHPHLPWCAPKKYWDLYDRAKLPLATNEYFPKGAPKVALQKYGELYGYSDIPKAPLTETLKRQSMHGYYASVSYSDAQLGRLMDALKKAKIYDNTVIVLVGDNGYQNGNNGVWCKAVNWESTNQVPLLVRIPGKGKSGQRSKALVELIDIYPTLCKAAGLKVPSQCEGKSLIPLVENPNLQWDKVACSQLRKGKAIGRSIRTDRYRFTIWKSNKATLGLELYDYKNDPQGNINLAPSPENKQLVDKLMNIHRENWPSASK
jgi:iduronate 2-sulfatase